MALPETWSHGRDLCPGDRPGHNEHPCHPVRHGRAGPEQRADRADPIASATGLGRARSRGDLAERRVDLPGSDSGRRRPDCRGRHHQPARDVRSMGAHDRSRGAQRHRLAGSPDGGVVRELACRRPCRNRCEPHGVGCRPLLFRFENPLVARQCSRALRTCPCGRDRLWHDRQFSVVAAFRQPPSCNRCNQRRTHDAVRHPALYLGCGTARCVRDPACAAARGAGHRGRLRLYDTGFIWYGDPDRRLGRRPTGGSHRPGLLSTGHDQDDLRHRICLVRRSRSPAWPAINRRRRSARPASARA